LNVDGVVRIATESGLIPSKLLAASPVTGSVCVSMAEVWRLYR